MKKCLSFLSLSAFLCGCSTWQKPAATSEQKLQAQYSCKKDVHQTWYWGDRIWGFMPWGLIETGVETDGLYSQCMKSKGWSHKSKEDAQWDAKENRTLLINSEHNHAKCVSELRSEPRYLIIQSHLPNISDNRFTFYQVSDATIPSISDSSILSDYFSGSEQCHKNYIMAINPLLSPLQRQIYAQRDIEHNAASAELSRRKISYGEWAQRENESIDRTKMKLQQ